MLRPYVEATLQFFDEVRLSVKLQKGLDSGLCTSVLRLPDLALVRWLLREGRNHGLEHLEVGLPVVDFHVLQVVTEEGFDLLGTVLRVQKLFSHGSALFCSQSLAFVLGLLTHFREERK